MVIALVNFVFCVAVWSQESKNDSLSGEPSVDLSSHQLGLNLSTNQGVGLSYKYWSKRKLGLQISALPIFIQGIEYFAGASLLYRFDQNRDHFPYASIGAIHFAQEDQGKNLDLTLFGIGAGYEFNIRKSLVFNIKIDLTAAYDWEEENVRFIPFPLPGIGLMYRF